MNRWFPLNLIASSLIFVCLFLFSGVAVGDTVYVNPNGSADFTTIQAAIDDTDTGTGDIVIVMPGTYVENINLSGKSITLRSSDPTNPSVVATTIIDGNENGSVITCNSGEDSNTVISGFIVTNGKGGPAGPGCGMFNENSSSPTVTYCTFTENIAPGGCGMYNNNSSPIISHCTFSNNTTDISGCRGGGMSNRNGSSPIITHCTFSGNTLGDSSSGGGMYNEESSATISYCTFSNNEAVQCGGMYNYLSSSLTVSHCTFIGNNADNTIGFGGGMNNISSSPHISHCTFIANTAQGGGGMRNHNSSSPVVEDCVFSANRANGVLGSGGGMVNYNSSSPTVTDCTFSLNIAKYRGGGMYNNESDPNVIDCTFTQNRTEDDGGGGIFSFGSSATTITRCAFVANEAGIHGGGVESSYSFVPKVSVAGCHFCYNIPQAIYNSYFDAGDNHLDFCSQPSPFVEGDIDGDGDVDMIDFSLLAGNWLAGT